MRSRKGTWKLRICANSSGRVWAWGFTRGLLFGPAMGLGRVLDFVVYLGCFKRDRTRVLLLARVKICHYRCPLHPLLLGISDGGERTNPIIWYDPSRSSRSIFWILWEDSWRGLEEGQLGRFFVLSHLVPRLWDWQKLYHASSHVRRQIIVVW